MSLSLNEKVYNNYGTERGGVYCIGVFKFYWTETHFQMCKDVTNDRENIILDTSEPQRVELSFLNRVRVS